MFIITVLLIHPLQVELSHTQMRDRVSDYVVSDFMRMRKKVFVSSHNSESCESQHEFHETSEENESHDHKHDDSKSKSMNYLEEVNQKLSTVDERLIELNSTIMHLNTEFTRIRILVVGDKRGRENSVQFPLKNHPNLFEVTYLRHKAGETLDIPREKLLKYDLLFFDYRNAHFANGFDKIENDVLAFIENGKGVVFTHDCIDFDQNLNINEKVLEFAGVNLVKSFPPHYTHVRIIERHEILKNYFDVEKDLDKTSQRCTKTHSTYMRVKDSKLILKAVHGDGVYLTVKENGDSYGRVVYLAAGDATDAHLTGFEKKMIVNIALWTSNVKMNV